LTSVVDLGIVEIKLTADENASLQKSSASVRELVTALDL